MSYLVLARKYRPQQFKEIIGQEHIIEILKSAIANGKIAHAYLFCGPRGIGKTSCARILAKALNCVNGPTENPCGKCNACLEITKGNSFDVLEIDGASNRGIDEIRTLRENIKFAPTYGKFKIYIVDEVHMLTTEAFNALLKTLEEPPEHAKFIFATTEPNKVPQTILSRCQRFDFKRISVKTLKDNLVAISKKEIINIEDEALFAISKAAQGSFRDALSILDQLGALSQRTISSEDVYSMLGLVELDYLFKLTDYLTEKNPIKALSVVNEIIEKGKDLRQLNKNIIEHFRNMMIIKIGEKQLEKLVEYPSAIKEMLWQQASKFEVNEIIKIIELFIENQETARITENLRFPLEVTIAKITASGIAPKSSAPVAPAKEAPAKEEKKPQSFGFTPAKVLKSEKGQVDITGHSEPETQDAPVEFNLQKIAKMWDILTHAISKIKMSTATYLQEGKPVELEGNILTVAFPKSHSFQKESLETAVNIALVEKILSENLRNDVIVKYKLVDALSYENYEPGVQKVIDKFAGKVVSQWHNE